MPNTAKSVTMNVEQDIVITTIMTIATTNAMKSAIHTEASTIIRRTRSRRVHFNSLAAILELVR